MAQSLQAIKAEGVISIIGFLGGFRGQEPSFSEVMSTACIVRGVLVGSRDQFEAMNAAIDKHGIKPVVDGKEFALEELREACEYMWEQKHFVQPPLPLPPSPF